MSSVPTQAVQNEESFEALLQEMETRQEMRAGEVITAEVVAITHNHVIVNAGLKSESLIVIDEFKNDRDELEVAVGDFVQVTIEMLDDGYGETRLSREKAKRSAAWADLDKALEDEIFVKGVVVGRIKGGLSVTFNGIRAFLPGSLVDIKPVKDVSYLEGQELDFKVIKLDRRRNNVVLSRRAVLEQTMGGERQKVLDSLHEGAEITGTVKTLMDYGAFLDIGGGVDGLLHITDLAWRRVRHPSEVLAVHDTITVKVLKFDKEKVRVSLGLKQLGEDPWVDIAKRYPSGARVFGKVTNLTDYGAFVEIEPGIEGLVHISEMDWVNKNVHPGKYVQLGDEIEVMLLEIGEDRRRISLGMKQCTPNPWKEFAENHKKGDKITGTIRSITDFGVFVGLEEGIDGLIHLQDLSWSVPADDAKQEYKKGDEVEVVVIGIDVDRERVSLGVKQLEDDPFADFIAKYPRNSLVKGVVKSVDQKGADIIIDDDDSVQAYLRDSEISRERVEDASAVLKAGDSIEALIINIDKRSRVLNLSIKAKEQAEQASALNKFSAESKASAASASTNLGALLKAKLDEQPKKEGGDS